MTKAILTVDDSPSIRKTIGMVLSEAGFEVVEAVDGNDGFAKATSRPFAAIITDQNMPGMNGIDFIRKFRAERCSLGVPIIFLSTESDGALKTEAKKAGALGWMVKPFSREQLLAVVRKVVGE